MTDPFEEMNSFTLGVLRAEGASPEIIRCMRDALERRLYYHGKHFRVYAASSLLQVGIGRLRYWLGTWKRILQSTPLRKGETVDVVSCAHFNFNENLKSQGFSVCRPPWNIIERGLILRDFELFREVKLLSNALLMMDYKQLCSRPFLDRVDAFVAMLARTLKSHSVKAVVVPNDTTFMEAALVSAARRAGIPSALFNHGLPGRYNQIDDNLCDLLLVWGQRIKDNYVSAGIEATKIHVVGSSRYHSVAAQRQMDPSSPPLLLTKAISGVPDSEGLRPSDPALSLRYLQEVREALSACNIRRCRIRPHPSESVDWYMRHLDSSFFEADTGDLDQSLAKASCVIAPTSTVLLDSLAAGTPFFAYEPRHDGRCIDGLPAFPPFDGNDPLLPVATTPAELVDNILGGHVADPGIMEAYAAPFDAAKVARLLGLSHGRN